MNADVVGKFAYVISDLFINLHGNSRLELKRIPTESFFNAWLPPLKAALLLQSTLNVLLQNTLKNHSYES